MSKGLSLFVCGLVLGLLIATFGFSALLRSQKASGQAAQKTVLKLGHGLDTNHPVHKAMERMKTRLEELSGQTVTIDIYPSAVLGSETQCIEQLQNGSLAMTKTSAATMESFIPEMSVFSLPYIFRDNDHYWAVLKGNVGHELLGRGAEKFLRGLCYYDAGTRNFYTRNKAVSTPDDLKGMKIRVMNSKTSMDMVSALGGAPTPIAWGELYSALAQGTVDGAENNWPSFTSNKHYEVCKHFTLDAHTRIPDVLLVSTKVWDGLPDNVKGWLQTAADESSDFQRKLWQQESDDAMKKAREEGVTIHEVDERLFAEKCGPMLDQVDNAQVKALLQRIRETNR